MPNQRTPPDATSDADPPTGAETRLSGTWLVVARVVWISLVGLALVIFVAALPVYFRAHRTILSPDSQVPGQLTAEDARLILKWGESLDLYAAFGTAQIAVVSFVFTIAGVLLFWRRSDDRMAFLISLWFAIFGVTGTPLLEPMVRAQPTWNLPVRFLQGASIAGLPILTYLFPDGHFVPRWTRALTFAWIGWIVISPFTPFAVGDFTGPSALWFGALVPGGIGIGVLAQLYRYLRVSNRVERQQAKWVVFGFFVMGVGFFLYTLTPAIIPSVVEPSFARVIYLHFGILVLIIPFLLIPFFIGLSILRYRLWDIDHLINRTLVYAVLTALLALAYFSSVVLLQTVFGWLTGNQGSVPATVLSTLILASLFVPLRSRVQRAIDRRFFRRKYDAARTLAAFAVTLRDEVELDRLSEHLVAVVADTMQPESVSLWLKPAAARAAQRQ